MVMSGSSGFARGKLVRSPGSYDALISLGLHKTEQISDRVAAPLLHLRQQRLAAQFPIAPQSEIVTMTT
jgi:hypothetical protein